MIKLFSPAVVYLVGGLLALGVVAGIWTAGYNTAWRKAQVASLKAEIATMKKDIEIRKDREKVMGKMIEQDAKVAEQLEAARFSLSEYLDGLQFEASLVGKTSAERERARCEALGYRMVRP
jgi:hypothetical protein